VFKDVAQLFANATDALTVNMALVMKYVSAVPPTQGMATALLLIAVLDYYTPLLAAPMCVAACYMSYVGFRLTQQDGNVAYFQPSKWPSGLLAAVLVWLLKSGMEYITEYRREYSLQSTDLKALWGVQIFGIPPGPELMEFIDRLDAWWNSLMGVALLGWGVFVRVKIVKAWPVEGGWERLMYVADALVFYCAVLLMAELSGGWVCVILCAVEIAWGLFTHDITVVMRMPALFLTSFLIYEHYQRLPMGTFAFFATSIVCIVGATLTHFLWRRDNTNRVAEGGLGDVMGDALGDAAGDAMSNVVGGGAAGAAARMATEYAVDEVVDPVADGTVNTINSAITRGLVWYQVLHRARLRQGCQLMSPNAGFLQAGEIVRAMEAVLNNNGVMRIRTPRGWVNTQASDGTVLLVPTESESAATPEGPSSSSTAGIVDIMLLLAFLIAFLDGRRGVTHGGLAFGLGVLTLPTLHFRGYPLLLTLTPLVPPVVLLNLLDNICHASPSFCGSGTPPELIATLAGCAAAAVLILLGVVKVRWRSTVYPFVTHSVLGSSGPVVTFRPRSRPVAPALRPAGSR
jgi:hypothetical protein